MPRRVLEGSVVSSKADKTITVLVERRFMHPMYKKYINSSSKYTAHDESNAVKEGDRVSIIECRPISKTKRWTVFTDEKSEAKADIPKKAEKKKVAPKKASAKKDDKKSEVKKAPAKKTKSTKKDA